MNKDSFSNITNDLAGYIIVGSMIVLGILPLLLLKQARAERSGQRIMLKYGYQVPANIGSLDITVRWHLDRGE